MAMFCASCLDIVGLEEKIRAINSGREEVFRPSSLREKGLIKKDWQQFGVWITQQRDLSTAKINKELARLYHWRWAYWHVMGSPDALIPSAKSMLSPPLFQRGHPRFFSETEETVDWLVRVAPLGALQHSNLGGKLWLKLKREDNVLPDWAKLCQTKFWVEEEWRAKREVLAGVKKPAQVSAEESIDVEEGTVEEQKVVLPGGEGKSVHWGPLGGLMEHVSTNVLWVEADDDDGVSQAVLRVMTNHKDVHILMTGSPVAVDKGTEQAIARGATQGCAASIITMFYQDDPALGPRGSLELSVERWALLLTRTSCGEQREHLQYATMHTKWSPGMLLYLLEILGAQNCKALTFVPHFCRSDEDVLKIVGWITASIPGLHMSFVLQKCDMHPPMVQKFLQEVIESKIGSEETVQRQMMVLMDGLPVQAGDMSKTVKELVEERKQALKLAHLQAKSEVQEDMEREALQSAASQDVLLGTQSTLNIRRAGSGSLELSQVSRSSGQQAPKKSAASSGKKSGATSTRQKEAEAKRKAMELEEGPTSNKSKKTSREPAPRSKPMAQSTSSNIVHMPMRRPPVPTRGGKSLPDPAEEAKPVEEMEVSMTMSVDSDEEEDEGEVGDPPSD